MIDANFLVWGAWLGAFLVLEGLAIAKRTPWTTLSEFAWMVERAKPITRWVFLVGLAVLLVHIVSGWPA